MTRQSIMHLQHESETELISKASLTLIDSVIMFGHLLSKKLNFAKEWIRNFTTIGRMHPTLVLGVFFSKFDFMALSYLFSKNRLVIIKIVRYNICSYKSYFITHIITSNYES